MNYLPCEIVETQEHVTASVIWLHGLGASGHDFVPIVPELRLPQDLGIRFIFPHAPNIPVTVNGGMVMPAWYDILAMNIDREIDHDQIHVSSQSIIDLIEREISNGIPSDRIVLAGFSQGGAVAYQAALSYDKSLAGLMTMSTYFATKDSVVVAEANASLPVHVFHGSQDMMVQEVLGQQALTALKDKGFQPEYKTYPMGHEVCMEEVNDISAWLQKILSS